MKRKKLIQLISLFIFTIIIVPSIAQSDLQFRGQEHHERIKSMKIAFLTDRLSLTSDEAQEFWPVYNQYQEELSELRGKRAREMKKEKSVEDFSEEEALEYAECEVRRIEETAEVKRNYHEKFLEILPVKKVALLYEAEKDFTRRLFREMRRRHRDSRRD